MAKLSKAKMKRRLSYNRAWMKALRDARVKREKRQQEAAEKTKPKHSLFFVEIPKELP